MFSSRTTILITVTVTLVAVLTIYLTPLKWLNLVSPRIHEVQAADFYAKFTENPDEYLFVDVRPESVYDAQHAQGAISIPIASLYELNEVLPKTDKEIVLICTTGRLAGVAYGYLEHQGFLNLLRLEGGIHAWKDAGLPVEGNDLSTPIPDHD